jgi:hypothetical protein
MAQARIRTTGEAGQRRLGAGGRDVVTARDRIAAILGNRIGPHAAALFAQVAPMPDGGAEWHDAGGGTLTPVAALPPERAAALRARHREIAAEIEALAARIESEGDAGRLAAHMMRLALVTPDGYPALHAAGDQPVLVNWGHAAEGQDIPVLAENPPRAQAAPPPSATMAAAVPDATGPAGAAPANPDDRRPVSPVAAPGRGLGWLAWALPLALLIALIFLIWLLLQPLAPIVVEREMPAPPPENPVPAALESLTVLKAELETARAWHEELPGLCGPVPETRVEPPIPQPEPEPKPEPGIAVPAPPAEPEPPPPPRPRPNLPAEVPRVGEALPQVTELPPRSAPEASVCEPGWTPTQRPEVMVVIDGSGSMRDGFPGASSRIDAAKESITQVVRNLHKDIETGLVSFTDCDETSTPRKYGYAERPELLSRVRAVSPTRGTSLANSIRRAGNAAKSVGPATVVVVSDGEDTCGGDPCAAARALKSRKPLLTVNVIDLSGGRSSVLQCVANATGGRVFAPRNAVEITREMQEATGQPDASQCNP